MPRGLYTFDNDKEEAVSVANWYTIQLIINPNLGSATRQHTHRGLEVLPNSRIHWPAKLVKYTSVTSRWIIFFNNPIPEDVGEIVTDVWTQNGGFCNVIECISQYLTHKHMAYGGLLDFPLYRY